MSASRMVLGISLVLAGLCGISEGAFVSVVPNGPAGLLSATTSGADPTLAGTVIADTNGVFSGPSFGGTYRTRVVKRDDTATLDFYYRITSYWDQLTSVPRVLRDFRISDYAGFTTEVTWRPDGDPAPAPGQVWKQALRFPQPQSSSDGINISFVDLVNGVPSTFGTGDESYYAVVRTDATAYKTVIADVYLLTGPGVPFDQFLSLPFQVYAPAIPEPASAILIGLGAGACVGIRRRRQPG